MALNAPAIVKAAETVLVEVENVVKAFPRYHRYAAGQKLREDAWTVAACAHNAWAHAASRAERVATLSIAIDVLSDFWKELTGGALDYSVFMAFDNRL